MKILFTKNLQFYFNPFLNILYWFLKFNTNFYYIYSQIIENNFIKFITENYFSLLFLKSNFYYNFFRKFIVNLKSNLILYFIKLKLRGLGFRAIKIGKNILRFYFIMVNFFYIHIPKEIILKIKKRKLFFLSLNLQKLKVFMKGINLLKKIIVYRFRGLSYPKKIYLSKKGKRKL